MTINKQQLIEKLDKLNISMFSDAPEHTGIKERVIHRYTIRVLDDLDSIFKQQDSNEPELTSSLRNYLASNHEFISGTMLSYTAIPNADVTDLMCDIAEYVAARSSLSTTQEPIGSLQVLMPGLCIEPAVHKYPALGFYQGFVNGTDDDGKVTTEERLIRPSTNFNIRVVLQSHILSDDGKCLIPVRVLLDEATTDSGQLINPYRDGSGLSDGTLLYVLPGELNRIQMHSALTIAVKESSERYKIISQGANDLYSQLDMLAKSLIFNSSHGGIGTDARAAEGESAARVTFSKFYNRLPGSEKTKIPEGVKDVINRVLDANGDCAGLLGENIVEAIKNKEDALRSIGQSNEIKKNLINKAGNELKSAKEALEKSLGLYTGPSVAASSSSEEATQGYSYTGIDGLGLSLKLLKSLDITININSFSDLDYITAMSAADIREVFKNEQIKTDTIKAIDGIENLITLSVSIPEDKLIAIIEPIHSNLIDRLVGGLTPIGRANQLSMWLQFLMPIQKFENVLHVIKDKLGDIIKSGYDFSFMLRLLSPEQITAVCEYLKNKLGDIIKSVHDFRDVLEHLNPEQITAVCESLKDKLGDIIKSGNDFEVVLKYMNPEQRKAAYESLKDKLGDIIKSGVDFRCALEHLRPEQITAVCESLKDKLGDIIKSVIDFWIALEHLKPEQITAVCESLKDKLGDIIKSGVDFRCALEHLKPEQRTAVYEFLKDKLGDIVKSGYDFRGVLEHLNPEQRTAVYESLKDKLGDIIKSGIDFRDVLALLSPGQCTTVCDSLVSDIEKLPISEDEIALFFDNLSFKCRSELFEKRLIKLIISNGYEGAIGKMENVEARSDFNKFIEDYYTQGHTGFIGFSYRVCTTITLAVESMAISYSGDCSP